MSGSHNVFGGKLYYYFYYAQKFGTEEIRSRENGKANKTGIVSLQKKTPV